MLIKCNDNDKNKIIKYISDDFGKCLYVYIDICKYSLDDNENFNVWYQTEGNDKINAIVTEYYKGIQIYSKDGKFNAKEIAEFVLKKNPPVILGMKYSIDQLKKYMKDYKEEIGNVGEIKKVRYPITEEAYSADLNELKEIVEILSQDEGIGKPYGFDSLYKQFKERKEENFGRNYVLRNEDNGEIICHAGTYAELSNLAVIGGVITSLNYRGKGYSKGTLAAICQELLNEGKRVFSFYYIPSAIKMHSGVGFNKIGDWAKLYR